MNNVLELNEYSVAELNHNEIIETEGGLFFEALAVGLIVAFATVVMTDWKEVERGFASTQ